MSAPVAEECRKPGRPRSTEADEAIIAATLGLFAEQGFDGLTVDGVAARAGVSKATIYRRYPSKIDLMMAAAACYSAQQAPMPDTGNVHDDVRAIVASLSRLVKDTAIGKCTPMMAAEIVRNPELAQVHRAFIAQRRAAMMQVVARAIGRGELAPDTDAGLVADMVAAPVFYRHVISGGPIGAALADALADAIVRAFAPTRASGEAARRPETRGRATGAR